MQVKEKEFLVNVFDRISKSVVAVNEKILAQRSGKISVEDLHASVAFAQLTMQQEMLVLLAVMVYDPGTDAESMPELPKKIIGFN
jgi:hypothetical protein